MELTAHQSSVGNVLQAGNQLIAQGNLTEEEEDEIREQMSLLNSRWESLRVASMDRQARYPHRYTCFSPVDILQYLLLLCYLQMANITCFFFLFKKNQA